MIRARHRFVGPEALVKVKSDADFVNEKEKHAHVRVVERDTLAVGDV